MEQNKAHCDECAKKAQKERENEEFSFAILVSLVPLLVLTLFGQLGAI